MERWPVLFPLEGGGNVQLMHLAFIALLLSFVMHNTSTVFISFLKHGKKHPKLL